MTTPSGWEGILADGERIVWQGRPDGGFHMAPGKIPVALFALFFAGFAVFWMIEASGAGGGFWTFGLIHFSVGAWLLLGAVFGATWRRRATWYTLTDRRAFIATKLPFRRPSLTSYPIARDTVLDYRAGQLATIYFAREERRGGRGRRYLRPVGFERISDGAEVLDKMRAMQASAA